MLFFRLSLGAFQPQSAVIRPCLCALHRSPGYNSRRASRSMLSRIRLANIFFAAKSYFNRTRSNSTGFIKPELQLFKMRALGTLKTYFFTIFKAGDRTPEFCQNDQEKRKQHAIFLFSNERTLRRKLSFNAISPQAFFRFLKDWLPWKRYLSRKSVHSHSLAA